MVESASPEPTDVTDKVAEVICDVTGLRGEAWAAVSDVADVHAIARALAAAGLLADPGRVISLVAYREVATGYKGQMARADRLQARIDAALALIEDAPGMELTRVGIDALRAALQGDQPTDYVTFIAPKDWRDHLDGADPGAVPRKLDRQRGGTAVSDLTQQEIEQAARVLVEALRGSSEPAPRILQALVLVCDQRRALWELLKGSVRTTKAAIMAEAPRWDEDKLVLAEGWLEGRCGKCGELLPGRGCQAQAEPGALSVKGGLCASLATHGAFCEAHATPEVPGA